jgi:hypothetical protein
LIRMCRDSLVHVVCTREDDADVLAYVTAWGREHGFSGPVEVQVEGRPETVVIAAHDTVRPGAP